MFLTLTLGLALLLPDSPPKAGSPAPQGPDEAYRERAAKAGRDPDAHVKLALWCEARGLTAERVRHLVRATLADPDHAMARGLLGLVSYRGKWLRPEELSRQAAEDGGRKALHQEYLQRRARARDTADDQWKLALWCDEHELKPQAVVHFTRVLKLDPRREAAWKRLGYRKQDGRWVQPEVLAAEKAEAEAQNRANKAWKPRLEKLRDGLSARDKARRAEAERSLQEITDPRAVPMIWATFARGDEPSQKLAVRLLSQIDAAGSSRALALLAVFSPSAEVRGLSSGILRRRDPRDFAGLVVGLIRDPIKYRVTPVQGPGSPGELLVEGKDANLRRVYTPLAPPSLMPGDILGTDASGMPIATRILGSHQVIGDTNTGGFLTAPAPADPGRLAQVFGAAGLDQQKSQELARSLSQNANASAVLPPLREGERYRLTYDVLDRMHIPLGQMILEAQASAIVAAQQLGRDVRNIEATNAPIVELNRRARDLLKEFSGTDLGADRDAWERWAVDLAGYAVQSGQSPQSPPPTITQEVPLDYQPQAAPAFSSDVAGVTVQVVHSCFGAGTPVSTLDGPRPIQDIQEGDQVLTQDTTTGALGYRPVVVAYHNPPSATYRIVLDRDMIVATGIHRFWKAGKGWVMARDLKPGDRLRCVGGLSEVKSVAPEKVRPVFNLQVSGADNFFVGEQAVLAHDNSLVQPVEMPFDAPPTLTGGILAHRSRLRGVLACSRLS